MTTSKPRDLREQSWEETTVCDYVTASVTAKVTRSSHGHNPVALLLLILVPPQSIMPPKSIFRQPGARHFQLVHRSQRDPLYHDAEASKHVLKPIERENVIKKVHTEVRRCSSAVTYCLVGKVARRPRVDSC